METILTVKVYYVLVPDGFRFEPEALSPARRAKIAALGSPGARALSAAAEHALSAALTGNVPGYSPPPALSYAPDGRPLVPGAHVSLAHTPHLAACAIAPAPVGIDAERTGRDLGRIKRKILSPWDAENAPLLDLWVAKEAYLKLTGEGIAGGMHNYAVDGCVIRDREGAPRAYLSYEALPGFRLAVCCGEPFTVELAAVEPKPGKAP